MRGRLCGKAWQLFLMENEERSARRVFAQCPTMNFAEKEDWDMPHLAISVVCKQGIVGRLDEGVTWHLKSLRRSMHETHWPTPGLNTTKA